MMYLIKFGCCNWLADIKQYLESSNAEFRIPAGIMCKLVLILKHIRAWPCSGGNTVIPHHQIVSMDDHHQEVLGFCREHCYDGVLGAHADYIVFDPPRYFSSQHLKLTYKVLKKADEISL